ncbi:uncharacterized protein BCR38DRAFT_484153 [Pseudomassariella vexata]|uniref:Uncharacterized protein n=1 Tax=Pseudomassariella vexata TaxID=1141098 RepID=A0A1Y2E4U1_9PEZI|nr:uncharacterized protein BCR38DRAFT_484153 [Pseudomassariella vexata]ORY66539.1 hypothetical protein BCR38DRAFT_484153 [Pseudomassariella vexata]
MASTQALEHLSTQVILTKPIQSKISPRTKFSLFTKLPPEIQLMIWDQAHASSQQQPPPRRVRHLFRLAKWRPFYNSLDPATGKHMPFYSEQGIRTLHPQLANLFFPSLRHRFRIHANGVETDKSLVSVYSPGQYNDKMVLERRPFLWMSFDNDVFVFHDNWQNGFPGNFLRFVSGRVGLQQALTLQGIAPWFFKIQKLALVPWDTHKLDPFDTLALLSNSSLEVIYIIARRSPMCPYLPYLRQLIPANADGFAPHDDFRREHINRQFDELEADMMIQGWGVYIETGEIYRREPQKKCVCDLAANTAGLLRRELDEMFVRAGRMDIEIRIVVEWNPRQGEP